MNATYKRSCRHHAPDEAPFLSDDILLVACCWLHMHVSSVALKVVAAVVGVGGSDERKTRSADELELYRVELLLLLFSIAGWFVAVKLMAELLLNVVICCCCCCCCGELMLAVPLSADMALCTCPCVW